MKVTPKEVTNISKVTKIKIAVLFYHNVSIDSNDVTNELVERA